MDSVDIAVILAYIFLIEAFYYPRFVVLKWRYAINPMTKKAVKQFSKTENQCEYFLFLQLRLYLSVDFLFSTTTIAIFRTYTSPWTQRGIPSCILFAYDVLQFFALRKCCAVRISAGSSIDCVCSYCLAKYWVSTHL